jgi:hypothetical protein
MRRLQRFSKNKKPILHNDNTPTIEEREKKKKKRFASSRENPDEEEEEEEKTEETRLRRSLRKQE